MKKKTRYYVEPRGLWARLTVGWMALSILLRLTWCIYWPDNVAGGLLWTRGVLPLAACVLFIGAVLLFGRKALWVSFFPALMGVLFFLLKAETFTPLHRLLCTLLYLAVAALYGLAVFGCPIRPLLIPLFGLPLAYHILIEDLIQHRTVYTAAQWVQEGSVLCIMAALLCISLGMRKAEQPRATCPGTGPEDGVSASGR